MDKEKKFEIKAYSKKELRSIYNVSRYIFLTWIKKIPELSELKDKQVFTPLEVQIFVKHVGEP